MIHSRISAVFAGAVFITGAVCLIGVGAAYAAKLSGKVSLDGSSTVFPISEAVAEEFQAVNSGVKVTVGISGTGGGFKKSCVGEIDISDASRPIKQSEIDSAKQNGIDFIELPIAFDGLSIVVNPKNTWVDMLTLAELKAIWAPGSTITNWSQVRQGFPNVPLKLFGPGTDSGTFEYFTEAVNGKTKESRSDFTASEDDNVLVMGVAGEKGALGYFGYAYYEENTDKLKLVPVDAGKGAVAPSPKTIANGSYSPLSRPLFIYVNTKSAQRPEVDAFVKFYLDNASSLVKEVGYVALPDSAYDMVAARYEKRKTGSVFSGKETIGLTIEQVLAAEK
jgi:phosphate transport system substrate-binding protein